MLKREDWIKIALDNRLDTEADIKKALEDVMDQVKVAWGHSAQAGLRDFIAANGGMLPTDTAQLAPFLPPGTDPAILQRFQMLRSGGNMNDLPNQTWLVADIGPVDNEDESIMLLGRGDMMWGSNNGVRRAAMRAYADFMRDNHNQPPTSAAQLQRYLRQPMEPKQLQEFWKQYGHQLK
jgi:hypothetical protein